MPLYQAVVLAVAQGFAEFLPISSDAHPVLFSRLLNRTDQGVAFDVILDANILEEN